VPILWLVAGIGLAVVARSWPAPYRSAAVAGWILGLAIILRRGWIVLFGPVFFHELRRGARRHVHLKRMLYSCLLLTSLVYVWAIQNEFRSRPAQATQEQAQIAQVFVAVFFAIQTLAILLVTPATIAGSIAEEKERRTLEFLLATDLRGHEIAFGRMAGRLANMVFLILAGVPVIGLIQVLGGVAPELILAAYAASLIGMGSIAGVSVFISTRARRAREGIVYSFFLIVAFLVVTGVSDYAVHHTMPPAGITVFGQKFLPVDVSDGAFCGNPFLVLPKLIAAIDDQTPLGDVLWPALRRYSIFHAILFTITIGLAVFRLRHVALRQMEARGSVTRGPGYARAEAKPAMGEFPMLWKELFIESGRRGRWWIRLGAWVIALASFAPVAIITWNSVEDYYSAPGQQAWSRYYNLPHGARVWEEYGDTINEWVRWTCSIVGTLALLSVAVRAAGSVSSERDRGTMDELLTTRLYGREIILSKWFGCLLGTRGLWRWVAAVALVGLCSGGLSVVGVLLTTMVWLVYSAFFAALGLWISVRSRTTFRATVQTLMLAVFLAGGHWLMSFLCCTWPIYIFYGRWEGRDLVDLVEAVETGLTPPIVLYGVPFRQIDDLDSISTSGWQKVGAAMLLIFLWLGAACILLWRACDRFSRQTGRHGRQPEREAPFDPTPRPPPTPATGWGPDV
jgi:ABC-type transport system involved in multi-copper enzyme maturation permease subunit